MKEDFEFVAGSKAQQQPKSLELQLVILLMKGAKLEWVQQVWVAVKVMIWIPPAIIVFLIVRVFYIPLAGSRPAQYSVQQMSSDLTFIY